MTNVPTNEGNDPQNPNAHDPAHDLPLDAPASGWEAGALSDAESRRLHEMEILARAEAEEAGAHRAPTELFFLMLAPLLLVALPLLLLVVLRGGGPALPAKPTPIGTFAPGQATAIAWQYSFDAALQTARDSGKNLIVDFYSDT